MRLELKDFFAGRHVEEVNGRPFADGQRLAVRGERQATRIDLEAAEELAGGGVVEADGAGTDAGDGLAVRRVGDAADAGGLLTAAEAEQRRGVGRLGGGRGQGEQSNETGARGTRNDMSNDSPGQATGGPFPGIFVAATAEIVPAFSQPQSTGTASGVAAGIGSTAVSAARIVSASAAFPTVTTATSPRGADRSTPTMNTVTNVMPAENQPTFA